MAFIRKHCLFCHFKAPLSHSILDLSQALSAKGAPPY
jgi:hypothetical protein